MYHAVCKVIVSTIQSVILTDDVLKLFIETACASECNNCCSHKSLLVLKPLFVSLHVGSVSVALYCVRNRASIPCTPSCRCWSLRRFFDRQSALLAFERRAGTNRDAKKLRWFAVRARFFWRFRSCGHGFYYCCSAADAAAKARLLYC